MKIQSIMRSSTCFCVDSLVFFFIFFFGLFFHFLSRSGIISRSFLSEEALLLLNILARRGIVLCKISGSFSMSSFGFLCFIYFEMLFL